MTPGVPARAPRGPLLSCKGWEQEGALRCLLNNLDGEVAEDREQLVVYGGRGRVARSWADVASTVEALQELDNDATLIVQSGRPIAVMPSHVDAPRVLMSTTMLVPAWSTDDNLAAYEQAGLTMYGQMTAAGWFYIGTQGVLGFTYETFVALADQHFGGDLAGRRVLTAGLGGMGGAQGRAITYNGGSALVVEVDERKARRRMVDGWVDYLTDNYAEALRLLDRAIAPTAVGLIGNIAEVAPRLVADGVHFDVATDQTAANDLVRGYIPVGYSPADVAGVEPGDPVHREAVRRSLVAHMEALLALRQRGTVLFEYGNNLRAQAVAAGVPQAAEVPGFIAEYFRPIFARGLGPYRWICLSGDPADLRHTEDAVLGVAQGTGVARWFDRVRGSVPVQGLPARICWLGADERDAAGRAINELVRRGVVGPVALGRDHQDAAAVASPYRETEGMLDGSDAIADWPVLSALLNAAQGASWVAIGNGGGVGVGRSIHSGMVVIADGSELAERKIERVFRTDPALGVARYVDAGYSESVEVARRMKLEMPGRRLDDDAPSEGSR